MTKIIHELSLVKPTIFGAVPRTLNKLVDKIKARIDTPGLKTAIKGKMLKLAMKKKRELLDQGIVTKDTNWDKQVLRQVQEWIYYNVLRFLSFSMIACKNKNGFFRRLKSK